MRKNISYRDFIHPADEAARRNLEAIPGFASTVKAFLRMGYEQFFHGLYMANKIRLSERQLPDLYRRLPPVCARLGIAEPEFYLEMNPFPNAYTFGDTRTLLCVTSGLLEYLEEDEIEAVIAHECGHIACRHVLYHSMARLLMQGAAMLGMAGTLLAPIRLGLLYWHRRSELSADRAAAAVLGSADSVVETMVRLSGGPKHLTQEVDIAEYAAQADAYDTLQESKWDKILQSMAIMNQNHPFPTVRVREIRKWTAGDSFQRMVATLAEQAAQILCPQCAKPVDRAWKYCQYCGAAIP